MDVDALHPFGSGGQFALDLETQRLPTFSQTGQSPLARNAMRLDAPTIAAPEALQNDNGTRPLSHVTQQNDWATDVLFFRHVRLFSGACAPSRNDDHWRLQLQTVPMCAAVY